MATRAIRFGVLYPGADEPRTNGVLLIDDGRVSALGDAETPIPAGAEVLEAPCVVPGLINAHVHLEMSGEPDTMRVFVLTTPMERAFTSAQNARLTLESGVTAVRDLGGTEGIPIALAEAVAAGKIAGPTIVAAGRPIVMTGGHGYFLAREADGPAEMITSVREQRKAGATWVKFMATGGVLTKGAVPGTSQLTEAELRAGIGEAHRHGLRAAAHAIGAEGIANALRAGIDSIEHGHLVDDDGIALLLERDAALVPTLAAIDGIVSAGAEAGMPSFVIEKARAIAVVASDNLRRALAAGVRFVAGSDAGTPFNRHEDFARELELMHAWLGMSPRAVLRAATVDAAALLDLDCGTIAVGRPADIVLLAADIESDARPFRDPLAVIRNGVVAFAR